MSPPGIYLDEDAQAEALIQALRARGIRVLTTTEARMTNRSDEDQLAFASAQGMVLATSNVGDFARLHSQWLAQGRDHSGLILIPQQRWGPGELARKLIRLLTAAPSGDFRNRLEFVTTH